MEGGRNEENQARLPEMAVAPPPQQCPRCDSFNTKFCYYNNYSLSQPRYFCKACRRYWTHGGTLRNVPVGGGCRKTKKAKATPSIRAPQGFPPPARAQSFAGKVAPPMNNSMFTGASILSSLAAMNSFPGNQAAAPVNLGGGGQFQPSPTHYFQPQPSFIPPAGSFNSWGQALINTGGASSSSSTPADSAAAAAATTTSGFWSYNNQTGSSFSPNAHPGFNPNQ